MILKNLQTNKMKAKKRETGFCSVNTIKTVVSSVGINQYAACKEYKAF